MSEENNTLTPSRILEVGMGFWATKTLLTAVGLELFTLLGKSTMSGSEIKEKLNLHHRSLYDFLDALVSMNFLNREGGIREDARYSNTPETALFLDKNSPAYMGGILEMCNTRLYRFWDDLEAGLKTGEAQNEAKHGNKSHFANIYATEEGTREFINAMAGIQMENFMTLVKAFDFSPYTTHCDIGGAGAHLSMQIVKEYPNIHSTSFDLPVVNAVAASNIERAGLSDRIEVVSGDFFKDPLPAVDVITMGNILHDWSLEEKKTLIKKAYQALSDKGCLIVVENIIDDERKENSFGLLMSLCMLIETPAGFDYSASDFSSWATAIGFKRIEKIPLAGPSSAVIAYKN